jgi:hypothetical protein
MLWSVSGLEDPIRLDDSSDRPYYVCVPPFCAGNEYHALTRPLGRAEAFKVCRELNTVEMADWSDLTRKALRQSALTNRV